MAERDPERFWNATTRLQALAASAGTVAVGTVFSLLWRDEVSWALVAIAGTLCIGACVALLVLSRRGR